MIKEKLSEIKRESDRLEELRKKKNPSPLDEEAKTNLQEDLSKTIPLLIKIIEELEVENLSLVRVSGDERRFPMDEVLGLIINE